MAGGRLVPAVQLEPLRAVATALERVVLGGRVLSAHPGRERWPTARPASPRRGV